MIKRLSRFTALVLVALAAALPFAVQPAHAQEGSKPFTPAQEAAIGAIVRDYLVANPQVLIEVMDALDAMEAEEDAIRQQAAIDLNRDALERDGYSYVAGNPDGAVTVVEFFDYRCPYCKQAGEDIRALIDRHDDVRIVLKEFPILGPDSRVASQAAMAAIPQGRYLDFHFALLANEGKLDRERVMEIAEASGLDTARLARDMDSARVQDMIDANVSLAREIGVRGTPAFVIADTLIPGAAPLQQIEALIEAARQASAKAG